MLFLERNGGAASWIRNTELEEVFPDEECLVSGDGRLLIVPKSKSDSFRGKADLYSDYRAFIEMDLSPSLPFEVGFRDFASDPKRISELAESFAQGAGVPFEPESRKFLSALDLRIQEHFERSFEKIDEKSLLEIVAGIGEAIRARSDGELNWQIESRAVNDKTIYIANLAKSSGELIEIALPVAGQIADPDHSSIRNVASSFVSFVVDHQLKSFS